MPYPKKTARSRRDAGRRLCSDKETGGVEGHEQVAPEEDRQVKPGSRGSALQARQVSVATE